MKYDKFIVYNLHKYAYLGKLGLFIEYYNSYIHKKYVHTLDYCIVIGILRNINLLNIFYIMMKYYQLHINMILRNILHHHILNMVNMMIN